LAGPGIGDAEISASCAFYHLAVCVDNLWDHAEEWPRRRAWLEVCCAGQRRNKNATRFRLPPGVDDWAAAIAYHAVIPLPCLRIYRLTYGAKKTKRLATRLLHRLVACLHQCADCRRGRVESVDFVLVDYFPETRHTRVIWHALEHQRRCSVRQRAVDDIAVTRNPADVGRAPVNILVVIVEDVLVRH